MYKSVYLNIISVTFKQLSSKSGDMIKETQINNNNNWIEFQNNSSFVLVGVLWLHTIKKNCG